MGWSIENIVSVTISDNKLEAYIQIHNVDEASRIEVSDLRGLLEKKEITYGIYYDQLAKIAANPTHYLIDKILVARGDEPKAGENGYIRMLYNLENQASTPVKLEDGTVDYRQVKQLNNVSKGQPIAERVPPKEGTPGKAVTGEMIEPRQAKEAHFKLGKNVVTDPEKNILYAAIDGLVTKTDHDKINVFPVYEVNGDVDYHIGNIDFIGNVVIRGNVLPGFKVKAAGDIRVIGSVEAAELEASGSIEITAGILGHNKSLVKAGQNVKAGFMQDANVEASEDITVTQSIMHSQVRAGRSVICMGSKGLIVGGTIQAGEKVMARTIGNTMSTPTSIEVGVLPELRNELSEMRERVKSLRDNISKTEKALQLLDQMAAAGQLSPDRLAMRVRLNSTQKATVQELEESQLRIMEIERILEDTGISEVEVTSHIYAGTKLVIGRFTRFIKDPLKMAKFRIVDGDISVISGV